MWNALILGFGNSRVYLQLFFLLVLSYQIARAVCGAEVSHDAIHFLRYVSGISIIKSSELTLA